MLRCKFATTAELCHNDRRQKRDRRAEEFRGEIFFAWILAFAIFFAFVVGEEPHREDGSMPMELQSVWCRSQ